VPSLTFTSLTAVFLEPLLNQALLETIRSHPLPFNEKLCEFSARYDRHGGAPAPSLAHEMGGIEMQPVDSLLKAALISPRSDFQHSDDLDQALARPYS